MYDGLNSNDINMFTDNLQTSEENITINENNESDNISICETSDIKLNNTVEVKEKLSLNVDNENSIQTSNNESMIILIY